MTQTADPFSGLTVSELVSQRPARARVFEKYGIDYCCGGKIPLADACAAKNLDPSQVAGALLASDNAIPDTRDWSSAPLAQLVTHIEQTHHAFLRAELPRLDFFTNKIANKHGNDRPFLVELRRAFVDFKTEREQQMSYEEEILFPRIRQLDAPLFPGAATPVKDSIASMIRDHDVALRALADMRRVTSNYTPHEGCCPTYGAVFASLAELESDVHLHIHKENNILFPRAIAKEHAQNNRS
jgi:regulator of cell morphogenesis and NO signaling